MNNKNLENDLYKIYYNINYNTIDLEQPNRHFIYNLLIYNFDIPNIRDCNNNTLLQCMIIEQDILGIKLLLNNNPCNSYLNNQNTNGSTALHLAIKYELQDIAKLLHEAGIDMNIIDNYGFKAIYVNDDTTNSSIKDLITKDSITKDSITKDSIIESNIEKSNSDSFINPFVDFLNNLNKDELSDNTTTNNNDNDLNDFFKYLDENKSNINKKSRFDKFNNLDNIIKYLNMNGGSKESSKLHDEVIQKIISLKYNEEDARYIKAGLYSIVKEKFSELSNLEKAKKLKEIATPKEINSIAKNIEHWKKIVLESRKNSKKNSTKINKDKKKSMSRKSKTIR